MVTVVTVVTKPSGRCCSNASRLTVRSERGGRILYMLLGSVSIAAIVVGLLSYRSFFTPRRHQLREFSSLSGPARGDTVG